jgi:hypothetical protein
LRYDGDDFRFHSGAISSIHRLRQSECRGLRVDFHFRARLGQEAADLVFSVSFWMHPWCALADFWAQKMTFEMINP